MEHITDMQLLDVLGGHAQGDERARLLAHTAQCSDCQQRLNELEQTWEDLGTWEIDASRIDLLPDLAAAIHHRRWHSDFLSIRGLMRIAASILLAAVIGHFAGRFSTTKSTEEWGLEAAHTSFLQVLSPGSATGWAEIELQGEVVDNN